MLSRQKLVVTIFGCVWPHGHTWANLGQMYLYDFYKIFRKCLYGYIIWKNAKKLGSPNRLRSGRPKCKLPSQLRKIVKATKRCGVKAMNLSACSNILGNIINALEMILNHQRAMHFIWQCCQGKTWPIPSLAVCCKSDILWPIWGGCTYVISIRFSGNVILSTYFQKLWQKLGVTRFV